ncbi:hypothetical protein GCM10009557_58790 [Virgisporangium ochraceum]
MSRDEEQTGPLYAVPAAMVAAVAARRAVGDWRGACAAAGMDVAVDLPAIARRHGIEVAAAVQADVRHLLPDLVRWHLPRRGSGGWAPLEPRLAVPLAVYRGEGSTVALRVRTPEWTDRPQRLLLDVAPVTYDHRLEISLRERWDHTRFRWDARETSGLLRHLGGDRTPFFHRDGRPLSPDEVPREPPEKADPVALAEWVTVAQDRGDDLDAWLVAGVDADFTVPERLRTVAGHPVLTLQRAAALATLLPLLRAELDRQGEPYRALLCPTEPGWGRDVLELSVGVGPVRARFYEPAPGSCFLVPLGWWRRSADVELLRFGHTRPAALHPSVRAALFPDEPAEERGAAYAPLPGPDAGAPVAVRCTGEWHQVRWEPGGLATPSHGAEDLRRHRALEALGGAVAGCFAVARAWRAYNGQLPEAMVRLKAHLAAAAEHGDVDEVERLLDAGVDPVGVRGQDLRTLLHHVGRLGRATLVPRLVGAGIDVDSEDSLDRTPLLTALSDGAPAAVVRALLDAGADATSVDGRGVAALHLVRTRDAADFVPRLVAAGAGVEIVDDEGLTPLLSVLDVDTPVEAIRALLDAGADPTELTRWSRKSIEEIVAGYRRGDLGFLIEAYRARR